ncbi:T9SS type A sorting domain-containing protein [Hymenobacter cellulosilyticus]|uniref:T9SS type A sorting domain-containing protein n=1 Tax=Hymenobacter cellulosilyticus TaxID=2932248 RepID=A0A8T9Q2R6_9BACT|nr:T9SS type A sorting domain-containing protein [Hymenobacter cellulosilyticus]UOQ70751.1 T9SS type A sorting domain-containing protein [Hymenobacter cellulosilyticus]
MLGLAAIPERLYAQQLGWTEAASIASGNTEYGYSSQSVTDTNGDVLMAGTFQGSITLGNLPALRARSFRDIYVAKMDGRTRQWLWAVRAGGNGAGSEPYIPEVRIRLDPAGNAIIAGYYQYSATFGNLPTLYTGYYNGTGHSFVAKVDGNTGTWLWATGATTATSNSNAPSSLAVDQAGNAVISGYFGQTVKFGNLPAITATGPNQTNIYVASVSGSTGQWQWVKQLSATEMAASGVAMDGAGNVVLVGSYGGTLTLGNLPPLPSGGSRTLYVAKLAPATGQWLWATRAAGSNAASSSGSASSTWFTPAGDVLVTGKVQNGSFQFGSLPAVASGKTYLAKLDGASGTWQWLHETPASTTYNVVTFNPSGELLTAGSFSSTVSFGQGLSLSSAGGQDIFVSKLNTATGQAVWAARAGGPSLEEPTGATISGDGSALLLTGNFENQTEFGALPPLTGSKSTFLARLNFAGVVAATGSGQANLPVSIYPNPAHDQVTIQLPAGSAAAQLTITNGLGQAVLKQTSVPAPSGSVVRVATGDLAPGVYYLRITAGKAVTTQKLVIQ